MEDQTKGTERHCPCAASRGRSDVHEFSIEAGLRWGGSSTDSGNFDAELDAALWNARAQVTSFPAHDLFSAFP